MGARAAIVSILGLGGSGFSFNGLQGLGFADWGQWFGLDTFMFLIMWGGWYCRRSWWLLLQAVWGVSDPEGSVTAN